MQINIPAVSIVLPTYNRATLLPDVISSILTQDYTNFELIIIDDGSTDKTDVTIRKIQKTDERLIYVKLPKNQGLGFARNAGLRYANGKYIALADSDDIWLANRLSIQICILEKYPKIDILFGDFHDIDHINKTTELGLVKSARGLNQVQKSLLETNIFKIESGAEIGLPASNFIAAPTIVMRKDILNLVGGFHEALAGTDLEFCWRAAVMGAHYAYIDKPLIERHIHIDSMTSQGEKPKIQRLQALDIMKQTCKRTGRMDLLPTLRESEIRTYRNLLRIYGEQNKRTYVIYTFFKSTLKCGISIRTFILLILALLGPKTILYAQKVREKV